MKFFQMRQLGELDASPFSVTVDGLSLTYRDEDAFPFIVYTNNVVFGSFGQEHDELESRYGHRGIELEGRFWKNKGVIAIWTFAYTNTDRNNEQHAISRLADALRRRLGVDTSKTRLYLEFYVSKTEERDNEAFIVGLSLDEYLSNKIPGEPNEYFWRLMNKTVAHNNETSKTSKNGMSNKDIWRHYDIYNVAETVKLNKNGLKAIVENVIKEYHKYQQLMLPFDGSDEPYNYMQFLEWLDRHSTPGTLPPETGSINQILNDEDILFDAGISSFYYGTAGEFDTDYYYEFLNDFVNQNGPQVLKQNITAESVVDEIPDVESTEDYLSPEGVAKWRQKLIENGRETLYWWIKNKLGIRDNGLVYVERAMDLESLFGRYRDEKYGKDYFETLEDNYSGIGEYWSYAHGGGNVYFYSAQHPQEVVVRGWVSPRSINWGATIALESMDEQELRLSPDAIIQIDEIEVWDEEKGKINLLSNRGSILMKML